MASAGRVPGRPGAMQVDRIRVEEHPAELTELREPREFESISAGAHRADEVRKDSRGASNDPKSLSPLAGLPCPFRLGLDVHEADQP